MFGRFSVVFILIFQVIVYSQQDAVIHSSSSSHLIFEYKPVFTDTSVSILNGYEFRSVGIAHAFYETLIPGKPAIPFRKLMVGVPDEFGTQITVLSATYKKVSGNLMPLQRVRDEVDERIVPSVAPIDDYEAVRFGEYVMIGDLPVQSVLVAPVRFSSGGIELLESIVVRISFPPSSGRFGEFDQVAALTVLNYPVARNWYRPATQGLRKGGVKNSVLSAGKWFRFEATEEGIHRITYQMLASYGIAASVDPRTIKIYGNGGYVVSEDTRHGRYEDLTENAITVVGEEDGVFNEGDYILFYARGPSFWFYDTTFKRVRRTHHTFSPKNYYWITSGGDQGKRIQIQPSLNDPSAQLQTTTTAFFGKEDDKINIGKTGRNYLGDEFSQTIKTRTYETPIDNYIENTPLIYRWAFANKSKETNSIRIEESGNLIATRFISGVGNDPYTYGYLDSSTASLTSGITGNRSKFSITFNGASASSFGYIDYFEIYYRKSMTATGNQLTFFSNATAPSQVIAYRMNGFTGTSVNVYKISDHANIRLMQLTSGGSGEYSFQAQETSGYTNQYFAVTGDQFKTPVNPVQVQNQNLRGITTGAKHIIITHERFLDQANRLQNYRQNQARVPMTSLVVTQQQIFNEFSGGLTDVSAIRDFIKHAYDNWSEHPEYVFLFGKGHYDYKNIENTNDNFVIPYENTRFLDEIESYCTDDFFAWVNKTDAVPDVAIGRVNVVSASQAKSYIDKLISYETSNDRDAWRNLITLVADDALTSTGPDGAPNTEQSETLSTRYIPKSIIQKKIYLTTYPTVQTSFGRRKPDVTNAIVKAVNDGTLLLNFIGHGSPELWTHEQVFVQSTTIPLFKNDRLFFLTAATCDFGYYDRVGLFSSTEDLLVKENSGAIGVFTAVRPVFSFFNAQLNNEFHYRMLVSPRDTLNLPITLGKAYQITKTTYNQSNDQKFHLFCDPALRLNLPQYNASVDSINGKASTLVSQIKALGTVSVKGTIKNESGQTWSDFNGEGIMTVYDSETEIPLPEIGTYQTMVVPGGIIFNGRISVTNGSFATEFVVPKDISYENKNGKVIFYFYNSSGDGLGFTGNVTVGGTDSSITNDGKGPFIDILFDNTEYENAMLVTPNSVLLVKLSDETGLNTTGTGVGHRLEGILNNNESAPIDFSKYFTGDLDAGGKSGKISYRFSDLKEGEYSLRVKAWDVFNNPSQSEASFKVVSDKNLVVDYVYNYPNPFRDHTYFTFQQSLSEAVKVRILIYTVAGRKVHEIEQPFVNDKFVRIAWDGRDREGDLLANGTYLYKLIVQSTDGSKKQDILGKFAIVR